MAYPYESGVSEFDRGDVGLESLRDKEPGNVLHNDVSLNNVCIGPFQTSGDFEHSITPVLKMIDFGQTVRLEEEEEEEQEEAEDEEDEEMNDDSDTSDDSERSDDEPMDEAPVEDAPMDDVQAGDAANPDGNDQDNGDKTQERTIERVAWQITLKNMAAVSWHGFILDQIFNMQP